MYVTGIHQVELTSRCNLRCQYCVHPKMPRPKQDMALDVFMQTLYWVRHFIERGTQGEVNLCGIGESTLHPSFCEWVRKAREVLGPRIRLCLATNGVGVTREHAIAMRDAGMKVAVSLHRPEKAGPTVNLLKEYDLVEGISADPALASVDWAGQIKWPVTAPRHPCPWLAKSYVMVASDGRVLTCSFDGQGTDGVLGTVYDDVPKLQVKPYSLCENCHQYYEPRG